MGAQPQRTPITRRGDAIAPLAGAMAVLLAYAASAQADLGGWGAYPTMPDDDLTALLAARVADSRLGAATMMVAALLMLVFAAVLWDRLRPVDGAAWPAALAAGGALVAGAMMTDVAQDTFAQVVAGETGDPVTARVLVVSGWESANVALVPITAVVGGVAIAGWRGGFRRLLAVLASVAAVGLLVGVVVAALTDLWLLPVAAVPLVVISVALAWATPAGEGVRPEDPPPRVADTDASAGRAEPDEQLDIELQ